MPTSSSSSPGVSREKVGTTARRRRPSAVVTPVESQETTPAIEPATVESQENPNVSTETAENVEATEAGSVVANKPGRKPMDQAERQRRATYRACEAAAKLLKDNGFTVEYPSTWENPEADRLRESAKRALEALQAAGIDPSTLLPTSSPDVDGE